MQDPKTPPGPEDNGLATGERVDHFEIERLVGRGGMGEVYLARDSKLGRRVALKLLRPRAFRDPQDLERFLHEARVTARFNHPHIVTAYSVGEHRGAPYVALEYLEGESLRARLERGPLPAEEAAKIALAVAEALAEAHRHGILHRDLKPENVLLAADGRLRVLDFGLAKSLGGPEIALAATEVPTTAHAQDGLYHGGSFHTEGHGLTGTPFYMAPEQWTEEPVTPATDLWSLGVMLYEMLAGERPFDGATVFVICGLVCSPRPSPSLAGRPGLPPELAELVARCLAKPPDERPSAQEAVEALRALSERRPRPGRRPRRALLAGAAALALALAGAAALTLPRVLGAGPDAGAAEAGGPASLSSIFPARMTSSRALLRVGVSELSTVRGSEVGPGVFWGLLHTEPDGEDVPFLARERPNEDNGGVRPAEGGGLEVTWHLRPDLRWSDGRPLEASDLVFGLRLDGDHHVVGAHAPDPRTLVVTWSDRVNAAVGSIRPEPRHVLEPILDRGGEDAVAEHLRSHPTPSAGPYHVVEFESGRLLVLEANPHFAGPPPSIARVEVHCASPSELLGRFEAGALDLIAPDVISIDEARRLVERRAEAVHIRPSATQHFLHPDLSIPALDRVEVRRALLMAIDRQAVVRELYGAEGRVSHAPVVGEPPEGVVRYEHAPGAAAAVLAAAGLAGTPLVLSHGGSGADRVMAESIGADLRAAGLDVALRQIAPDARLEALRRGRHGGLLLASTRVFEGTNVLTLWNLPRSEGRFELGHRNSAFDDWVAALVEREAGALYPERRAQHREAIWVAYSERLPQLPIALSAERVVVDPALRGWDFRPGDRFGRGLERWYFVR